MTELVLIQQSLNGNTSSFEQLVLLYEKQLIRFLKLRCFNVNDAEDIFQETFLNAHLYLRSYDQKFAFSTWLFNIALNLIKRHAKTNKAFHLQMEDPLVEAQQAGTPFNFESPQITAQLNDTHNLWHQIKAHLTDEQFHLLWFTYAEGYNGSEVAIILERSLPWVKINLVRIKKQLKTELVTSGHQFTDLVRG